MIDDEKSVHSRPHAAGMVLAGLLVIALASVLLVYVTMHRDGEVSIPNPETVTCSQFAGLSVAQQKRIAHELGKRADGQSLDTDAIEAYCGIAAGPNDPVSGATSLGS